MKKQKLYEWYDFFESFEKFLRTFSHLVVLVIFSTIIIMHTKLGEHVLNYNEITKYHSYQKLSNNISEIFDGSNINYSAIPLEYNVEIKSKILTQKKKVIFCHYSYNGRILKNQLVVVLDENNKILKINEKFSDSQKYKKKITRKIILKIIFRLIIMYALLTAFEESFIDFCKYRIKKALKKEDDV